jgi:lipopolysaccharide/colanic/teichoic acid biosynthesis glycosyltransferase
MLKRIFDLVFVILGLIVLSPLMLFIALWIVIDSKGGVFYRQTRVGKNGRDFLIYKFRTMHVDADRLGLLTIGGKDKRVTKAGYYLRKYKLDELAQLINVLNGSMSLVGPRPEVRKYVNLYTDEQRKVLSVKPGITDRASIIYRNENELLAKAADPEQFYIKEVMPEKLKLNLTYVENNNLITDLQIILQTIRKLFA